MFTVNSTGEFLYLFRLNAKVIYDLFMNFDWKIVFEKKKESCPNMKHLPVMLLIKAKWDPDKAKICDYFEINLPESNHILGTH